MYIIEQNDPPPGFRKAWQTAGVHLQRQVQDHLNWLRTDTFKPFIEHLSFRLGNQIFWVFLELEENGNKILPFSGNAKKHFLEKAAEANIWPCVMPMEHWTGKWAPTLPGWGLRHAVSGEPIEPLSLVSEELIEMSDWEIHDMALQVVRAHLKETGKQIGSFCSYQDLDPSIWFQDENGRHWVVVRAAVYPSSSAPTPENIADIADTCAQESKSGYFASVTLANNEDEFLGPETALPLYRGHGVFIKFSGLEKIQV